jgi:hypothetical protein
MVSCNVIEIGGEVDGGVHGHGGGRRVAAQRGVSRIHRHHLFPLLLRNFRGIQSLHSRKLLYHPLSDRAVL